MASPENLQKGAYVIMDSENSPDIIIIATGSELHLAIESHEELKNQGINSRVVSMPSWELFEKQSLDYKEQVLPLAIKKRISVEAASTFGWEKYVGLEGISIGMKTFGASAPGNVLMEEFEFNVKNIVSTSLKLLNK